jgi:hypothetical protein
MFNLEQAITNWRRQLIVSGIKTPVPMDELEGHFREEIERQMQSGLDEQKAFETAVGRIGKANSLKQEFQKISSADKAQLRKRAGYFYAGITVFYTLAATCAMFKYNLSINEWLLGLAAQTTLLCLTFFAWRLAPPFFLLMASRHAKSAVGLIGGVSGAIWFLVFAYFILPCFDFTTGQFLVAVLWAMVPTLVLPTTAFLLLDKSEHQQFKTPSS